jgi:nicotinate-nucleotide adenylyltransferase
MRIGLLGGTFDPVHYGHLDLADAALTHLGLDEVWFVPAGHPPHRDRPGASAAHRFAMLALALAGRSRVRLSDVEMGVAGPTYTIDTLGRLEVRHPELAGRFVFIIGADAFAAIKTWRQWSQLLDRCRFAVVARPGYPVDELPAQLPELADRMSQTPAGDARIVLIDAMTTDISATALRNALAGGGDISTFLPTPVAEYAVRERLYPPEAPRG